MREYQKHLPTESSLKLALRNKLSALESRKLKKDE